MRRLHQSAATAGAAPRSSRIDDSIELGDGGGSHTISGEEHTCTTGSKNVSTAPEPALLIVQVLS